MTVTSTMARAALGGFTGLLLWGPLAASAATSYGTPTAFNRPGFTSTMPWDISDSGVIVGQSDGVGFIYSGGVFSSLVHPDSTGGTGIAGIANDGTLVGGYWIDGPEGGKSHAFIHANGVFTEFNVAGAAETNIRHISSNGRYITGYTNDPDGGFGFAFDRVTQTLTNLSVAGDFTIAQGANSLGQVSGSFSRTGGSGSFVVDLNTMTRTEYFGVAGAGAPRFRDINDSGVVAGFAGGGAYVGKPGDWTVVAAIAGSSTLGYGLNNAGAVVGYSTVPGTSISTGWLAAPVPEPETWALMALGLASLALRRRSRG
jgi:hypothetical protein